MCSLQCSNRVSYQSHKTIARYTYSGQEGGGAVRLLFWGERKLDNHQTGGAHFPSKLQYGADNW